MVTTGASTVRASTVQTLPRDLYFSLIFARGIVLPDVTMVKLWLHCAQLEKCELSNVFVLTIMVHASSTMDGLGAKFVPLCVHKYACVCLPYICYWLILRVSWLCMYLNMHICDNFLNNVIVVISSTLSFLPLVGHWIASYPDISVFFKVARLKRSRWFSWRNGRGF